MKKVNFNELIIFEDDDYIAVNKPPLLATLEDRASSQNLLALAKRYTPDAQMCHRLDKETSGVLLIAKNPEAYRSASIQFEKRQVKKVYHAIVDDVHDFNNVEVNHALQVMGKGQVKISSREGKDAHTVFNTIKAYKRHTLVECIPTTGRMHQIRVHLASLNASIVNDEMYGGKWFYLSSLKKSFNVKKWSEEQPLINRFALHAYQLTFFTMKNNTKTITAPYPKDFRVLEQQLSKNS